jgi:hypothetical protein
MLIAIPRALRAGAIIQELMPSGKGDPMVENPHYPLASTGRCDTF